MANSNEYMREYMNRYRAKRRAATIAQLGSKCCKCGSSDNLQFDHIDPTSREWLISDMFAMPKARLQSELAKCQLLCQPCHNLKTLSDLGQKPRRGNHGTVGSYRYCRPSCDACRKAVSNAMAKYRLTHQRKKYPKSSIPR